MTTSILRFGLAAGIIVVAGTSVHAQDAVQPLAVQPAPCSGLMCMLSNKPQPAAAAAMPVATPVISPDQAAEIAPRAANKVAKPVKIVDPVTIAVDWTDVPRLKQIAAIMPGSAVKLVKPTTDDADFKVTAGLGEAGRGTKLRLFSEQVHIIAGPAVHSVSDLKDKVVSFGPADGPTRDVARKSFEALGMPVKETPLDYSNAFDGLATGDVDAVVVVAPQPSTYLAGLNASGWHLLAWPDDVAPPAGSTIGTIAGAGYPHLAKPGDKIRTVAVDAVLSVNGRGEKQTARAFLAALAQHSAALSKRGFDLLKADIAERGVRRVASVERR